MTDAPVVRRMLDTTAAELAGYTREQVVASIRASEGRTLAAETIAVAMPALHDVSNPELAAAMGADLLVLNLVDLRAPAVAGVPVDDPADVVREVRRLTGRLVLLNLEPVDPEAPRETVDTFVAGDAGGRLATDDNVAAALRLGVDGLVLTGNPGMGVTNTSLVGAVRRVREVAGPDVLLLAGRMHAAGSTTEAGSRLLDDSVVDGLVDAGADVVLLPAPGTVPGCHEALVRGWVERAHAAGALTMTTVGTSQEGADVETIRRIALMAKMTGTDVHHLGDCGYFGVSLPENLLAYSIAIRGRRHAYRRMARSLLR